MSDPVTQDQVEDVLSSIRRLVSDKERTAPARPQASGDGRLVLTPSLRVADPLDTAPLDLGAVAKESWTPPLDEDAAPAAPQETSWDQEDHSSDAFWEEPEAPTLETEPQQKTTTTQALTQKIAALEEAIGTFQQEFEPDEPGTGANSGTDAPGMAWEDDVELDATGAPLQAAKDVVDVAFEDAQAAEIDADSAPAEMLRDVPNAAEAEPAQGEPTFLPRHSLERENAAAASDAMIDLAEQEIETATAEPAVEQPEQPAEAAESLSAAASMLDEQVLDEEALREIISQIVRAELQGALGERITRNVRKLVRREIYRALAAQDLD